MRQSTSVRSLVRLLAAGVVLVFTSPVSLAAAETEELEQPSSTDDLRRLAPRLQHLPNVATSLDADDAAATLEGINLALAEVGDGGSYVWHRRDGRLSGMAQPTASFRDQEGQPCRHLIVMLNTPERSRKVEGIACRTADRRWHLSG